MTLLVCARAVYRPLHAARQRTLGRVRRALLTAMADPDGTTRQLVPLMRHPQLVAEVLLDYAALVRGDDREVMITVLEAADALNALARCSRRRGRARRLCVEALAMFPAERSAPVLKSLLSDPSEIIRLTAASGLAAVGAPLDLKALKSLSARKAVGARNSLLRQAVLADPATARSFLEDSNLSVSDRATLLDSLGLAGDYPSIPLLVTYQRDRDPVLRASAILALGHLMHPDGHDAIARALSDPHWCVRAAAAKAVGLASFEDLVPRLEQRLRDPIWSVRLQAADSLKLLVGTTPTMNSPELVSS